MKYSLLSSVAGVAIIAATSPVIAGNDFSGVAQFTAGMGSTEASLFGFYGQLDDPLSFDGDAKGIWPLSQDIHFQVDLTAEHTDNLVRGGGHESATLFGATAHLLHPFENRARFGLAGSLWDTDLSYLGGDYRPSATYGLAAVEGQFFGSDWTLTGQAGLFNQFQCSDDCGGSIEDGTYGRAKIRYFLHDNTSLSVEMLQMWGTINDGAGPFSGKSVTNDYTKWALEAEHRFDASPWSGTLAVSHEQYTVDLFETSIDTNTVSLGLKFYLDQPTLRAHDRSGAEMDTPNFGYPIKSAGELSAFYGTPD